MLVILLLLEVMWYMNQVQRVSIDDFVVSVYSDGCEKEIVIVRQCVEICNLWSSWVLRIDRDSSIWSVCVVNQIIFVEGNWSSRLVYTASALRLVILLRVFTFGFLCPHAFVRRTIVRLLLENWFEVSRTFVRSFISKFLN